MQTHIIIFHVSVNSPISWSVFLNFRMLLKKVIFRLLKLKLPTSRSILFFLLCRLILKIYLFFNLQFICPIDLWCHGRASYPDPRWTDFVVREHSSDQPVRLFRIVSRLQRKPDLRGRVQFGPVDVGKIFFWRWSIYWWFYWHKRHFGLSTKKERKTDCSYFVLCTYKSLISHLTCRSFEIVGVGW